MALFVAASFFFHSGGVSAASVQYVYDELGRLIAVIDPAADVTEYAYDEVGNLLSVSRRSAAQVSIISFSPSAGQVGDNVTIVGTAFSANPAQNAVQFNGTAALVTSATLTSLTVLVPSGATTGPISITTPSGTATTATAFVVREVPQIASFSPLIGEPGGTLTISGRGFGESELGVVVNKTTSQVISKTPATLSARIPSATGGKISVTTPLGTATSTDDLFIVPPPRTAADVVATGRIAIDGPGRVLALSGGKVGLVLFDGVAGASGIRVSLGDATLGGTFSAFRPDGVPLASGVSFGATGTSLVLSSLPVTGTYGVLVVADAGAGGNVTVAASTGAANSLSPGESIVLSVAAGQTGTFTFSGTAGDFMGLEVASVSMPNGGTVQVIGPNGTIGLPVSGSASFAATTGAGIRMQQLVTTGTYTVQVQPSGGAGSAQFTLWKDVAGSLTVNSPNQVNFLFRNQQARFSFTAAAGDSLGLDLADLTLASGGVVQGGTVQVFRPDGLQIGLPVSGSASFAATSGAGIRMATLTVAGTYTVVVTPDSSATGTLKLTLWRDVADPLTIDTPFALSIPFRNQGARLTFIGAIGDSLAVEFSNVTLPGGTVQVIGPNGAIGLPTAGSATFPASGGVINMQTLTTAGTYTMVITPSSSGTGGATVRVFR